MSWWKELRGLAFLCRRHLGGALLLAGSLTLTLARMAEHWEGNDGEMLAWLLLDVMACWLLLRHWDMQPLPPPCEGRRWEWAGAILLALSAAAMATGRLTETQVLASLVVCAGIYVKRLRGLLALVPYAVGLWVIPLHDAWRLWLSYPLRHCATDGCAWLLRLLGIEATVQGTTLLVNQTAIAVTGHCSGIDQFDAMLAVAVLLSWAMQRTWLERFLQAAFFLPAILLANILRLFLVVVLARWVGPQVYVGLWHTSLGYVQLLSALGLLTLFGLLIRACRLPGPREIPYPEHWLLDRQLPVREPEATVSHGWLRAGVLLAGTVAVALADGRYLLTACMESPRDRLNWVFWVLGELLVALEVPWLRRQRPRMDWLALAPFLLCVAAWGWAYGRSLHIGLYLAGMVGLWTFSWLVLGWRMATWLAPGVIILLVGCPSVSYLIGDFPVRCAYAAVAGLLALILHRYPLHRHDAAFGAAVIVLGILGVAHAQVGTRHPPFVLADPPILQPTQRLEPVRRLASDYTFFRHSRFWRYRLWLGPRDHVGLLYVRPGTAISEIHPAGHCLRSSGATIHLDVIRTIQLDGQTFQVNEIDCQWQGSRYLFWALYGDAYGTTASFAAFRLRDSDPDTRFSMQLNTEMVLGSLPQARHRLLLALRTLRQRP